MPRCLDCGNRESFGSSLIQPAAPTANGPPTGLVANFNQDDQIDTMESLGASLNQAQEAWEAPHSYFDICMICGSSNILW